MSSDYQLASFTVCKIVSAANKTVDVLREIEMKEIEVCLNFCFIREFQFQGIAIVEVILKTTHTAIHIIDALQQHHARRLKFYINIEI